MYGPLRHLKHKQNGSDLSILRTLCSDGKVTLLDHYSPHDHQGARTEYQMKLHGLTCPRSMEQSEFHKYKDKTYLCIRLCWEAVAKASDTATAAGSGRFQHPLNLRKKVGTLSPRSAKQSWQS
jgi:hypothetical protein